jgi:hypothetical protein
MAYSCDIGNGQRLLVQNHGEETQVALSSAGLGRALTIAFRPG